ncbi:MAG: HAD family phosphatase [Alphaproteobacteria bacterium]|nr:HAD family phosphatase [Alphaproteobacteria bacterium]MCL2505166.1 HAD family phosphatase [Alphaproteobacteria bacterium]
MNLQQTLFLFDCDGVLVDSEFIACEIVANELNKIGFNITTQEYILRFCGRTDEEEKQIIEKEMGKPLPENFRQAVRQKTYKEFSSRLLPIKGIEKILTSLSNKCVASGGSLEKINNSLRLTKLDSFFLNEEIFSASMVARGKPNPDLFLHAAHCMGYLPSECFVIEDSISGIQAAKAANMKAIGFIGGSHCSPAHKAILLNEGADFVFDNMADLSEYIKTIA